MARAEARWAAAFAFVFLGCAVVPLLGDAGGRPPLDTPAAARGAAWPEPPRAWRGRPLRPLALAEVEQRFADRFPGRVMRATDGDNVFVFRDLDVPTRMLHPAADCYRGLGYRILEARLERDAERALWRCFEAERAGRRVRVCERIVAADGTAFTDASSWFWAAQLGRSRGPWQAVTVASPS